MAMEMGMGGLMGDSNGRRGQVSLQKVNHSEKRDGKSAKEDKEDLTVIGSNQVEDGRNKLVVNMMENHVPNNQQKPNHIVVMQTIKESIDE